LGLLFAPFTYRTVIFVVLSVAIFFALPTVTRWLNGLAHAISSPAQYSFLVAAVIANAGVPPDGGTTGREKGGLFAPLRMPSCPRWGPVPF
jgi:hypothetical protein